MGTPQEPDQLGLRLDLSTGVRSLRRTADGIELRTEDGSPLLFDAIVVATDADQALRLFEDPNDDERFILGAFKYTTNEASSTRSRLNCQSKIAIVTGSASRLGRVAAELLAREEAAFCVVGRNPERTECRRVGEPHGFRNHVASANDQPRPEPPQRVVEIVQRRGEQPRSTLRDGQQPVVESQQRQHLIRLPRSCSERGIVLNP